MSVGVRSSERWGKKSWGICTPSGPAGSSPNRPLWSQVFERNLGLSNVRVQCSSVAHPQNMGVHRKVWGDHWVKPPNVVLLNGRIRLGNESESKAIGVKIVYPPRKEFKRRQYAPIYGWEYLPLNLIYPGFDCGSYVKL